MNRLRLHQDESGMALMTALLAIVILSGLVIVFMNRAVTETRASGNARDHETAIHVAESAADNQISFINDDDEYVTTYPDTTRIEVTNAQLVDETSWALGLRDALRPAGSEFSSGWVASSTGEAYAVRPFRTDGVPPEADGTCPVGPCSGPLDVIYAVGAVPSFGAPNAKVRVIKLQIDQDLFIPEFALITDGPLTFGGNAAIVVPDCDQTTTELALETCIADVHTNADFTNPGNSATIQGRVSQVDGLCPSGATAVNGCVDSSSGVEDKPVPEFNARDFYNRHGDYTPDSGDALEWFDLCPPGTPVAQASIRRPLGDQPCSAGSEELWISGGGTTEYRGWKWAPGGWRGSSIDAGVFYVYHADAKVTGTKPPGRRSVSILVEQNPASKANSGSLDISGNPNVEAAMESVLIITDADLDMQGTAAIGSCGEDPGAMSGFIGVGEQLKTQGTVSLRGAIMVRDAADDHGLVKRNTAGISGTMCLEFDPTLAMRFSGVWVITFWNEL